MPFALVIAFAASLGLHLAALFGPDIELSTEPETPPLLAELRPAPHVAPPPAIQPPPEPAVVPAKTPDKTVAQKSKSARRKSPASTSQTAVLNTPDTLAVNATKAGEDETNAVNSPKEIEERAPVVQEVAQPAAPEPAAPRLPPHGMIRYRVDRGDSNFEIGASRNEWDIVDGHYRLVSVVETTGLVRLFKSYRIEMESRGLVTSEGLQPAYFSLRRNADEIREKAAFDWDSMRVRVGDQADQVLSHGAQDLLSFNYQLGYMSHPEAGGTLPIATGKKYGIYRLEVLGDEEIVVPAGTVRTLHIRAPGVNTTELWLAYDYLMLPVKIRHVDSKGGSLVQLATEIQVGNK